jgi:hypothetical protein
MEPGSAEQVRRHAQAQQRRQLRQELAARYAALKSPGGG